MPPALPESDNPRRFPESSPLEFHTDTCIILPGYICVQSAFFCRSFYSFQCTRSNYFFLFPLCGKFHHTFPDRRFSQPVSAALNLPRACQMSSLSRRTDKVLLPGSPPEFPSHTKLSISELHRPFPAESRPAAVPLLHIWRWRTARPSFPRLQNQHPEKGLKTSPFLRSKVSAPVFSAFLSRQTGLPVLWFSAEFLKSGPAECLPFSQDHRRRNPSPSPLPHTVSHPDK